MAGSDFTCAVLKCMNKMKDQQTFPHCLQKYNVTSIYKNKGSKFKSHILLEQIVVQVQIHFFFLIIFLTLSFEFHVLAIFILQMYYLI